MSLEKPSKSVRFDHHLLDEVNAYCTRHDVTFSEIVVKHFNRLLKEDENLWLKLNAHYGQKHDKRSST